MRIHEDFGPIVKSLCLVMISTLTHFNTLEKSGQIVMQQIQPRFFFSKNVLKDLFKATFFETISVKS